MHSFSTLPPPPPPPNQPGYVQCLYMFEHMCVYMCYIYRCPTRQQNRDYVMYLLKVLYLESNVRKSLRVPF